MPRGRWSAMAGPLALALALVAGCQEYELRPNENTDVFTQEVRNTVDILLVVDNSCSMVDEQVKLADNFQAFIDAFGDADVDYQIGVVTTDMDSEHHRGRLRCSADVIGTEGGPFTIEAGVNDTLELDFGTGMLEFTMDAGTYAAEDLAYDLTWAWGLTDYAFASATEDQRLWITTDLPCDEATLTVGGGNANDTFGFQEGDSMTGVKIITPDTPDAARHFAANVHVGGYGSGYEKGLEAAHLALQTDIDPEVAAYNEGFLRTGDKAEPVALSLVFISDEEDQSPDPVSYYLDYFYRSKSPFGEFQGYRDETILDISAVVGDVPDGCEQTVGEDVYPAQPGYRYIDLAMRTGGIFDSICNEDFSPMVAELGLNISGLRSRFTLSRYPDELTLVVQVKEEGGALEDLQEGWIYDCEDNAIVFDEDHVPPTRAQVHVTYTVVSRPAGDACGGAQ